MTTGYYLYDNPNPNAPIASNGIRFWGYPTRQRPIDCVVVHTAENLPDWEGTDGGAEAVADYAARTDRAVSFHATTDSDSDIEMLPDEATGFHVRNWNSRSLGLEIATQAHTWAKAPDDWVERTIDRAANRVAGWCATHDLEPQRVTKGVLYAGGTGIISHAELDPTRRTDPGEDFPWTPFLEAVEGKLSKSAGPTPLLTGPMCFIDRAVNPAGGEWWLIADGGVANFGGAPYYGHLLDPATLAIISAQLGIPAAAITYDGNPRAIVPNRYGGYTIWTDREKPYIFHPGTTTRPAIAA